MLGNPLWLLGLAIYARTAGNDPDLKRWARVMWKIGAIFALLLAVIANSKGPAHAD